MPRASTPAYAHQIAVPPEPPVQDTRGRNVPIPRQGCLHGPFVGTDNDEDINHDPDYDPLAISEEELELHEASAREQ